MLQGGLGLRASREVYQNTQVQPLMATVEKTEYKARSITLWSKAASAIHATRDYLTAPVWGATKPNEFITVTGQIPKTPTILHVPTIHGSNMPEGGSFL